MDFSDALHALKQGFRLTRADWPRNRYIQMSGGVTHPGMLRLHIVDACSQTWLPSRNELMAEDWRYHHSAPHVPILAERGAPEPRVFPAETHGDLA